MKPSNPIPVCDSCEKSPELCICPEIRAGGELKTRVEVVILQHPQEPDKELGSARIAQLALPNSKLKIGLSWPNLSKAVGHPAKNPEWAVLYLGSGIKVTPEMPHPLRNPGLHFVDKKGNPTQVKYSEIKGLIVLDGTWSQAKTLWWRNAWLLKLRRVVLVPRERSLYRELRREPRGECLSTIESLAESLTGLGESASVEKGLKGLFATLLEKQRARLKARAHARRTQKSDSPNKPQSEPSN